MGRNPLELMHLAIVQRWSLWALISSTLFWFVAGAMLYLVPALGMAVLAGVVWASVTVAGMVQACRLKRALDADLFGVTAAGLLMAVPVLGVVVLWRLDREASAALLAAGVRVGWEGVSQGQLEALKAGVCRGCGYDMGGLDGKRCPECGLEKPMSVVG